MKLTKQSLDDIGHLIFDGYITSDVMVGKTYILLRSLNFDEKENILERYKFLRNEYNLLLIIDFLAISIVSIGGIKLESSFNTYQKLLRFNSSIIMSFYRNYLELDQRISEAAKFLDYYIETDESKYNWGIFKVMNRNISLETIKKINQFQYYWIVVNFNREIVAEERREWMRTEYMTNSICAFINPKEFRRLKSKMSVTDKFDSDRSKLENKIKVLELLEKSDKPVEVQEDVKVNQEGIVEVDQHIVDEMRRKDGESKDDYSKRVSELMKRTISGEVVDEHDKVVRRYEMKLLKDLLLKRRTKSEVLKELRKRKRYSKTENMNKAISDDGVFREKLNILGSDEDLEKIDEEIKKGGFYYSATNYIDIVSEKAFMSLPKNIKQEVFDEAMKEAIDIKKEVKKFLDSIRNKSQKKQQDVRPMETTKSDIKDDRELQSDSDGVNKEDLRVESSEKLDVDPDKFQETKNAAAKASQMDVKSLDRNLLREKKLEKQQKMKRYQSAIERRDKALKKPEDGDSMFFG